MPPAPEISVALSLDPNPHSYSSPCPPTFSVTVTSHADKPLTVFAWSNIFRPSLALLQGGFSIKNLTTQTEIHPQHSIHINRMPFKRRRGDSDEQYFLTLSPSEPLTVHAAFGYNVEGRWPHFQQDTRAGSESGQGARKSRDLCAVLTAWFLAMSMSFEL